MENSLDTSIKISCASCDFAFVVPHARKAEVQCCPVCRDPLVFRSNQNESGGALLEETGPVNAASSLIQGPADAPTVFREGPPSVEDTFSGTEKGSGFDETVRLPAMLAPTVFDKTSNRMRKESVTRFIRAVQTDDPRFTASESGRKLTPGSVVAGCRIIRLFGEGGMGQVYEVERIDGASQNEGFEGASSDSGLENEGQYQALKIIRPDVSRCRPYVEAFLKEGRFATALRHPNIIRTYEAGFQDNLLFTRMELAPGGTLQDCLDNGIRFSIEDAAKIIMQVGKGLAHAHSVGILHRDVKPANILVDDSGSQPRYLLSDLGLIKELGGVLPDPVLGPDELQKVCDIVTRQLSKLYERSEVAEDSKHLVNQVLEAIDTQALERFSFKPLIDPQEGYTQFEGMDGSMTTSLGMHGNECLGTPLYMAVEQIEGRRTDERTDIYALGTVFFHLIAGRPPYTGASVASIIREKLMEPSPPMEAYVSRDQWEQLLPFSRIIDFMLERDRRCRYRTMAYCLDDISRVLEGQDPICNNARFIYEDQLKNIHGKSVDLDEVSLMMNLLQTVFEMA